MALNDRIEIIQRIQELRNSKVIVYFNSDRRSFPPNFSLPGLVTQIATESQIFLYDQLRSLGKTEKLDLFLYTRGGQTDAVWPLVSIFREYALEKFSVLVPFRAHSAGTLICLGADEIVMGEGGELSPIDPTTGNQFNPLDEIDHQTRRGISVEDVTSYIQLARDDTKVGLKDSNQIMEIFKKLSEEVHPLALGNVNRVHNQIRILADKLLKLHLSDEDAVRTDEIVDMLTRNLYSHTHAINRDEAIEILGESSVVKATDEEQNLLWQLYEEYAKTLKLRETLCVGSFEESEENPQELTLTGGFIETELQSSVFHSQYRIILSSKIPQGVQVNVPPGQSIPLLPGFPTNIEAKVLSIGWELNEKGE